MALCKLFSYTSLPSCFSSIEKLRSSTNFFIFKALLLQNRQHGNIENKVKGLNMYRIGCFYRNICHFLNILLETTIVVWIIGFYVYSN